MSQRRRARSLDLALSLILLLLAPAIVSAQTVAATSGSVKPPLESERGSSASAVSEASDAKLNERLVALEEELRQQNKMLTEMRALVADQQRVITALAAKATSSELKNGEPKDVETTVQASQNKTPTLEDRVKKVEDKVLAIGPFRLSGDFRLRFDGIFRKADPTPPVGFAPLTHQQNARMRYRLRLNLDTDVDSKLSFHSQLATGPINNSLTMDQDFGETTTRHPFFISEAWIDYHPKKTIQLQAGRVQEVFADNSRFLFDDDVRFNGFNEKYSFVFKHNGLKVSSLELRAGQYIFSNPNVAIDQKFNDRWSSQFGGDIQLYRNPNQIQLASTVNGVALIVQNGLGITLSGPLTGAGNATTTSGGAIYTARNFQIARVTYRLNWAGFQSGGRAYPVTFNFQAARNVGISLRERNALLASLQIGKVTQRGDMAFLYVFAIKGANALISQVTDDDLGTNSGVNIRTNHFRFDYGLSKKISLQSLLYIQNELRNSGDFPNFFVPLNAFTPRQYRLQEQIVFSF